MEALSRATLPMADISSNFYRQSKIRLGRWYLRLRPHGRS
jgi:hypothetical protein